MERVRSPRYKTKTVYAPVLLPDTNYLLLIWAFPCGPGCTLILRGALATGPVSAAIPNAEKTVLNHD
jgi:hypothetical protein